MNSDLLKQKRNYYNKNRIPYRLILDNNYTVESDNDFIFWDDASETLTVIRKNSKRGQGTFVAEEFSSAYEHIQHIVALHTLKDLRSYMEAVLPSGSYTAAQLDAVETYMGKMVQDESYIQDLMPEYTNKFDKKIKPNPVEDDTTESEIPGDSIDGPTVEEEEGEW